MRELSLTPSLAVSYPFAAAARALHDALGESGGGTIRVYPSGAFETVTTGFAVGGALPGRFVQTCTVATIEEYLTRNAPRFADSRVFGIWQGSAGVFIDTITIVPLASEALAIGAARGELAVFHRYTRATLTVSPGLSERYEYPDPEWEIIDTGDGYADDSFEDLFYGFDGDRIDGGNAL